MIFTVEKSLLHIYSRKQFFIQQEKILYSRKQFFITEEYSFLYSAENSFFVQCRKQFFHTAENSFLFYFLRKNLKRISKNWFWFFWFWNFGLPLKKIVISKTVLKKTLKRSIWKIPFLRNFWKNMCIILEFWVSFQEDFLFETFSLGFLEAGET